MGMKVDDLYIFITSQMTPEVALKRLLASSLRSYEHLKFPSPEQSVDPVLIIAHAALDLGWSIAVKDGDEEVQGLAVGTDEYMKKLFNSIKKEDGTGT